MFNFRKQEVEDSDLEQLITSHISSMDGIGPETEEYTISSNNLKTLMEAREIEEKIDTPWRPSADTVALVAGNLLGILAILTFEKANVITSKSLSFVLKQKN